MKDLSGYLKLRKPARDNPRLRQLAGTVGIATLLLGSSIGGALAGDGATYDGSEWSDWQGYEDQPAKYVQDPAPVVYQDEAYVSYLGDDGHYYFADGAEWTDISGDYEFEYAPAMNVYGEKLYVYGTASDGYVYWKDYDGSAWGEWGAISDETTSAYEVYAVDWDGYNNVFWTDEAGATQWNRWDGSEWTGAKALPGDYEIADAVYAVGYDDSLYAMGSTEDGKGAYNVFKQEDGWSGWAAVDGAAAPEVKYQPAVHVYEDEIHAVYTGGDGHGYYVSYGQDGWTEYQDLGDNYAYEPGLYEYGDAYHVTYTGEDGYAYYKEYKAGEKESDY